MSVQIHPCLQLLQPPNLGNKLISRKLPSEYEVTNNGSKPCNKKCCKLCNQINPSKNVDTQKGSSISPDHTAAPLVMLCTFYPVQKM
ncbi:unnamed protein product [Staurois parvus]|uniref:Uncharacterized protein n=1 Tax=Staurois parvus TaxID=386267 RepID=A0ABN9GE06_9NEOB|nr:unnamed protein product [Staurois parvus]